MDLKEVLKDVDRDIRVNVVNTEILDAMSFGKTFDEKRELFIREITREVEGLRRVDYSRYDRKPLAWDARYLGKPVDLWMVEKAVDAGLEYFAQVDGVKYQRVNTQDGLYMYLDADGDRVYEDKKVPKEATSGDFVWSKMKFWAAAVPMNTKPLLEVIADAVDRSGSVKDNNVREQNIELV